MATKNAHSPPLPSAPFRFATLTSTTRWGGGQNKTLTTNRKRKVPNLFQDLTYSVCWFLTNFPHGCDLRLNLVVPTRACFFLDSADRKSTRLNSSHLGISYAV